MEGNPNNIEYTKSDKRDPCKLMMTLAIVLLFGGQIRENSQKGYYNTHIDVFECL
jgi:hypothetical protein